MSAPTVRTSGRTCKSCRSEKRPWIDQEIKRGRSDVWISNALADMGVKIGRSSIMRHRINCLGISAKTSPITPSKTTPKAAKPLKTAKSAPQRRSATDTSDIVPTPLTVDSKSVLAAARMRAGNEAHLTSFLLREITLDQIAIVKSKQTAYMSGEGENPVDDIRALQTVHSILKDEAIIANINIDPDAPVSEKAKAVAHGVIKGEISPANAEKLLGILHRQLELTEYQHLSDEVRRLTEELTGETT